MQVQVLKGAPTVEPTVELGGHRWVWEGTLTNGQFFFSWPGQAAARYGPGLPAPERGGTAPSFTLAAGDYTASFACRGPRTTPVRVRFTFQPPERLDF